MNRDFQPFPRGGGYVVEHAGRGDGWPDSLLWVLFALLLLVLLLMIVSVALDAYYRSRRPRHLVEPPAPGMPPGPFRGGRALAVLDLRYARGEVARDDYLRAREDLGGPRGPADESTAVIPPGDDPEPPTPEGEQPPAAAS